MKSEIITQNESLHSSMSFLQNFVHTIQFWCLFLGILHNRKVTSEPSNTFPVFRFQTLSFWQVADALSEENTLERGETKEKFCEDVHVEKKLFSFDLRQPIV
jgi:hypothetical protein